MVQWIFVIMIYDLKDRWDALALERGIVLDNFTNSIIVINDALVFSNHEGVIFLYLESILEVSKRYNLSWKLEKCDFSPNDLNLLAQILQHVATAPPNQRHPSLKYGVQNKSVLPRDFASFIGLVCFYRSWIPEFLLFKLW